MIAWFPFLIFILIFTIFPAVWRFFGYSLLGGVPLKYTVKGRQASDLRFRRSTLEPSASTTPLVRQRILVLDQLRSYYIMDY